MSQDPLKGDVEVWWQAVDAFTQLLEHLPESAWSRPTDLPGWDVHDVAAHTAHLEAVLAGAPHDTVDIGQPAHVRDGLGRFTEQGVVARRGRGPDELINEIREGATARHTRLLADPPSDPEAPAEGFPGLDWSWRTLLRNRPLDVWMHEQDIRRATGIPGGLDSAAARHTTDYLAESLGFVLGRKVGAAPGTTLAVVIDDAPVAFTVDDAGRGQPLAVIPTDPTVGLRMSRESFIVLAGGRRSPDQVPVTVAGDPALADQILTAMGVTP